MRPLLSVLCLAALAVPTPLLAGDDGYLDAMAREHAHDAPVASPAAATAPQQAVEAERRVYATLDGKEVRGYFARPANGGEKAPGVIVIHEWWGLNENIEAMARQLAGEGYQALAVDLYEGKAGATAEEARALAGAAREREGRSEENLRQAYAFLTQQGARKVGTLGWCFGGGWSLRTAELLPDKVAATVIYYGRIETDPAKLQPLQMPILGHFGSLDGGIPLAAVRQFEAALKGLGKPAEIHVYEGADHAFANPSGTRYKADAAELAWTRTLAFLAKNLKG